MTAPPSPDEPIRRASRDDAIAVVRRLRDAGHVAYFAGGCVRDQLLGLEPKDYDVATDAPPDRVRQLFSNTQAVGAAFGVILVRIRKSQIEVATFRTDGKYLDGRRPEAVVFTTAEEDARRRDFTINGMFYDPVEERVIDYVGGQADLANKLLRAIGEADQRFEEDHLRMLRAVRFSARFELRIEPQTADAVARHAAELKRISPERVAEELRAMLRASWPSRVKAWRTLWQFGLLPVIFRYLPERAEWPPAEQHRLLFPYLGQHEQVSFGFALAGMVLTYRIAAQPDRPVRELLESQEIRHGVQACRTALRISNEEADVMAGTLDLAPLLRDELPTVAQMKRFLARPTSDEARLLLRGLGSRLPMRVGWLEQQFNAFRAADVAPPPLVSGDDLTAAGMKPGPVFKRVLDAVYDAQLEDRVRTKEEALGMAIELARHGREDGD